MAMVMMVMMTRWPSDDEDMMVTMMALCW